MKTSLDNFPRKTIATKVITSLSLILTLNNFVFDCKNYIQIRGCAMGTICAPSYANIFLDHFEIKCYVSVFTRTFINLSTIDWSTIYSLYRQEVKNNLFRNLDELNAKHNSIKLEYKISNQYFLFWIQRCTSRITK